MIRRAVTSTIVAILLAACGAAPSSSPSASVATGFVAVGLEIAPEATQFYASQHRGRVVALDGSVLADWEITAGSPPVAVPAGSHRLQASTVFLSDFIQCSADPAAPGKETCAAPTLGPSQVCTIAIEVLAGRTVEATYRSLPDGRCELRGDPMRPTVEPGAS